jgi:hypothetical protein
MTTKTSAVTTIPVTDPRCGFLWKSFITHSIQYFLLRGKTQNFTVGFYDFSNFVFSHDSIIVRGVR